MHHISLYSFYRCVCLKNLFSTKRNDCVDKNLLNIGTSLTSIVLCTFNTYTIVEHYTSVYSHKCYNLCCTNIT